MSGAVTIEVEMPSGYAYVQSDANQRATGYGFIRDVLVVPNKVVWMLEKVVSIKQIIKYGNSFLSKLICDFFFRWVKTESL